MFVFVELGLREYTARTQIKSRLTFHNRYLLSSFIQIAEMCRGNTFSRKVYADSLRVYLASKCSSFLLRTKYEIRVKAYIYAIFGLSISKQINSFMLIQKTLNINCNFIFCCTIIKGKVL